MRSAVLSGVAAAFALLHVAAVVAPAVVLAATADKGGVPGLHGAGLLAASAAVGVPYAAMVWTRLRRRLGRGEPLLDVSIAGFDALVVLALTGSLLLFLVLGAYAPVAAVLVNRGWPLVALWVAVQLLAVVFAESTRRAVLRWLDRPTG